jgi:hypothetical protein
MDSRTRTPGVALAVLRRGDVSTDILLISTPGEGLGLPWALPRDGESQWALSEALVGASGLVAVERLYASPLSIRRNGQDLGIFAAFAGTANAAPPLAAGLASSVWMDLREAERELSPAWGATLSRVREHFVARPPDEALRIR